VALPLQYGALLAPVREAIGKMQTCGPSTVKRGHYLRTRSAFYLRAMVTNEVRFPVYKPVDYTL